jgi:hypothetical protein
MVLYLFMKAVSTGAMLLGAILWLLGSRGARHDRVAPAISTVFIGLTSAVLVFDLERPERFYYILTRSNWRSWLVWGAWFLPGTARSAACGCSPAGSAGRRADAARVAGDRVRDPGDVVHRLPLRAGPRPRSLAGAARGDRPRSPVGCDGRGVAAPSPRPSSGRPATRCVRFSAGSWRWSLLLHILILLFENVLSPSPTRHHEIAVETIRRGAFAPLFWGLAIAGGGLLPLAAIVAMGPSGAGGPSRSSRRSWRLAGGAAWEYIWVEAGQSVPLS